MADNYKVKINVEIVKCADAVTDEFTQVGIGIFEHIILAEQAQNIDTCEQINVAANDLCGLAGCLCRPLQYDVSATRP